MSWLIYNPSRSDRLGRMLFWRPQAAGYTDDLAAAGRFEESYAKHIRTSAVAMPALSPWCSSKR